MEQTRLNINSLYGGGRTKSNSKETNDKKKKSYFPKNNSFTQATKEHYKDEHYKDENKDKQEISDVEKWRKQNRILQRELNDTKKELELMKKKNEELKRRLNL
tara:strand:+ start:137 stop:445 length:309 start_codon:yes stop_codon:yes gene_type:complete